VKLIGPEILDRGVVNRQPPNPRQNFDYLPPVNLLRTCADVSFLLFA
jgi:hypothetical protein